MITIGNPEKIQNFVKKKSHGHKNSPNQKSLCAKLLNHIKNICTKGFFHIFKIVDVTFILDILHFSIFRENILFSAEKQHLEA